MTIFRYVESMMVSFPLCTVSGVICAVFFRCRFNRDAPVLYYVYTVTLDANVSATVVNLHVRS